MTQDTLQQFYIPEEQSIYLLSHQDAKKLKDWFRLCEEQLRQLGYRDIELVGKGAFGFVFAGVSAQDESLVFKFSRITLPQHYKERLEEEAFMLSLVEHSHVPRCVAFQMVHGQPILAMERARGQDLEQLSLAWGPLSPGLVVRIAAQLADILRTLRRNVGKPVVHGDIKPSNIMFDPDTETAALIDWGSSVFAQLDEHSQPVATSVMELMSDTMQQTNARLGDVYFIGEAQLNGGLSSPRFDEEGLAGTLYALASGQSCRFGYKAIPPTSLGLPIEFARVLEAMLAPDPVLRSRAGDYFLAQMPRMAQLVMMDLPAPPQVPTVPVWLRPGQRDIDTVVYSSRKSFLREEGAHEVLQALDDAPLDRYYKEFLQGMGDTEKAFLAAVSRLGKYPVVGGLAVRWEATGVYIDSSLNLHDERLRTSFIASVNNMVNLARAIRRRGIFKSCLFDARDTLHIDREQEIAPFVAPPGMTLPYEISTAPDIEDKTRMHSYFEDGRDPDEFLELPGRIMDILAQLNSIHHTGMIIFESLPNHLKIHSYYRLLDPGREAEFADCLARVLQNLPLIKGLGVAGFMKLPYKDTRFFTHIERLPEKYYPRNPRSA
ncbi:protein kinase domain-containing protein [Marinobacterium rhizophilum]|uniref:Phosphotransferase n=1 Tax=Marinobacterium rhizophilum TaxID=420402 RepID=A0ABY5HL35_9GAMM|nr:protein kinase [Marinobacterium rhizophilum]UTW13108.1 phosphotransferase [Marinobacterium rhizophilum]